ncbi:(2E,6E)-farnesyl diphosphate synthase [Shewanella morhuae]|uniref:(2E,6E)-farnesyl diphosphate synthase n=1 Tax=Shewanella morhuae TaxID=365591 RepID=A0ABX5HU28_9GAMM|nr:(2E,6E)-farnesyl diphosphate synthase [Shewanella morhuae]PTA49639.1 (2E,6E)-farnesyl diphosphate synthase [Shewanella morhuae]SIQ56664.1 farnesyl-diphosphate synthase [Shewanella morhuae]
MLASTIQEYQQRVDNQLKQRFNTLEDSAPTLKAAMTYGALLGGKRIRPFLVYSIGRMFGLELDKLDACAAAIECIHAYSLIHDDLPAMDNDELRRGQPTVHIAFDEATAILAGDALQTLAFEIITEPLVGISSEQHIAMVRVLAKASGYRGMCGGQAIDLASTNKNIDLNALTQLHNMKTGALISCAVELALIAANAPKEHYIAMMDFARAIGLAFQVQDDILDIIATTEELGKPQGSDTESNKSTFPQLLGLQGAQDTAKQLVQEALSVLAKLPYNSQLIADFARYIIERRI